MHRRDFIRLAGGGVVLAAAPACAPAGPDPAAAWTEAGTPTDPRRFALSYAVLAPNPHNRQHWLARLDGADTITLFVDRQRLLPVTDPFSRQILIGCGAFLELLTLAAGGKGQAAEVIAWPDGEPGDRLDPRPFARVRLTPTKVAADPLFAHIVARRSNKQPYEDRIPSIEALAAVAGRVAGSGLRTAFTNAAAPVAALRDLTNRAHVREIETPAALKESIDLMRIGAKQIAANRDGISLDGPMMEALRTVGILTPEKLGRPGTIAFGQSRDYMKPMAFSTQAYVWLISEGNSRATQLASGRAYARLNLLATATGLAIHPNSQALQEFAEMAPLKVEMDRLTGVKPGERLQMLVRAGYAKPAPPAPRRGLKEHLIA